MESLCLLPFDVTLTAAVHLGYWKQTQYIDVGSSSDRKTANVFKVVITSI